MRIAFFTLLLMLASCRFPKYTVTLLQKNEGSIQAVADYILEKKMTSGSVDSVKDARLVKMLKSLHADRFDVILKEYRAFLKPDEPLDSIIVISRVRKSSALMWGGEEIIYHFATRPGKYPDYSEADGYLFRKITSRIYYRRYYFRET